MAFLILSACALFISWIVHIAIWRWRLPQRQIKVLIVIFAIVWAFTALAVAAGFFAVESEAVGRLVGFLYFSLVFWSAALCYVITYSAMEGDSPTLSLTRHLHRRGEKGVSQSEIDDFFRQRPFIGARVRALVSDRILIEESGGYRLRSGKYLFFRTILLYRRIVFGPVKAGG